MPASVVAGRCLADDTAAVGWSCPGAGDCCLAHETPGCEDFDCCDLVCSLDDLCCAVEWTEACAGFAFLACPDQCGSGCPGSGDCCLTHAAPGCEDLLCCEAVCFVDSTCCASSWDAGCAAIAASVCSICVPPFDCPGAGDCCADNVTPGCDDAACCETVCSFHPQCCEATWNAECAQAANVLCGEVGEDYCGFCPGEGSCCEFHLTPGCDRPACCELVCAQDLTCCTDRWSLSCRGLALDNCAASVCDCDSPGDFDGDGRTTLSDVAEYQNCYTGPGGTVSSACPCADLDGDGSADATDTQMLGAQLTGP